MYFTIGLDILRCNDELAIEKHLMGYPERVILVCVCRYGFITLREAKLRIVLRQCLGSFHLEWPRIWR